MSKVKFEGLIEVPSQGSHSFKQSLLVPLEASMGPQVSVVNSKSELYSKIIPSDFDQIKSLNKYLDLGYELVIYRTNYKDTYSSIRLNETGYSYFDINKTYTKSIGPLTSNTELKGSLTCIIDLNSIIESLFRLGTEEYNIEFYVKNFSYLIHVSKFPLQYSEFDYVEEVDPYTNNQLDLQKVKNSIIEFVKNVIGLRIEGSLIRSEYEFKCASDIPHLFLDAGMNSSYDIIHSNSLSLPGLSLVSRNPNSDGVINLSISKINDRLNFRISSRLGEEVLFEESFIGDDDPESNTYILDQLKYSKLIRYVDGEWSDDYLGEYELGYLQKSEMDIAYVRFDASKLSRLDITFIADPRNFYSKSELWSYLDMDPEWNRPYDPTNEDLINDEFIGDQYVMLLKEFDALYKDYVREVTGYLRRLTNLAIKLDTVAMVGDIPVTDEILRTFSNLIVVNPRIVDLEYNYTYELLLSNLSTNRLCGDVEFNGRLSTEIPTNSGISELIYTQYKYLLTETQFRFMSSKSNKSATISLSNYMVWYAVLKYLDKVIKSEFLGKMNEVNLEELSSLTLTEFKGFLRSLSVTDSKSGRTLTLQVSMELETQTRDSLILTGYLIGE